MSKIDTGEIRDEIRRQKNKPWYVKSPWFEKELVRALDEIDSQAAWFAERDKDSKLFVEEQRAIEQRTKEAIKARIISSYAGHDIHSLDPVNITIDEILEAIDSVGDKA